MNYKPSTPLNIVHFNLVFTVVTFIQPANTDISTKRVKIIGNCCIYSPILFASSGKGIMNMQFLLVFTLVTSAWRVLRLRMEGRPPDTEGSCEYIE
jgi:hypothetical protein